MKKIPVVLIILAIVLAVCTILDFRPKNTNAVVFTEEPVYTKKAHPLKYAHYEFLDADHDGIITKNEMVAGLNAKHEYRKDAKDIQEFKAKNNELKSEHKIKLEFTKSLDARDRNLIEGLSFKEAKKAIHLPNEVKANAMRMNTTDKILYLQNQILK
jgi:hypothetical protein